MKKFIKHFPNHRIVCFTTTRDFGGVRRNSIPDKLYRQLKIKKNQLLLPEQIHGNNVAIIESLDGMSAVSGTDGLITSKPQVYLAVRTADCIPLFFYDENKKLVGIAHAGWKGSMLGISSNIIKNFVALGSRVSDLKVHIGPHIQRCCFEVDYDLGNKFLKKFKNKEILKKKKERTFLDLKMINISQLLTSGVKLANITFDNYCTFCERDLFYSYRRDFRNKKNYQLNEMISVISLI